MHINEMRSSLEADHAKRGMGELPNMPAWAVRRVFEKRNGLSLTPLPAGMEVRSVRSILATARPALESKNQEALSLRLMIARMFNGN
jgi:hypothetical protein